MELSVYNDKKVRLFLHDGSTFEGFASHNPYDYSLCEFGIDAECLQICEYLIRDREIERAEIIEAPVSIRSAEEELDMIFAVRRSFSEHLHRWEDNELPDNSHFNCFEYSAQPSPEEFESALNYQKERGDAFIKLEGPQPLENDFGLHSDVMLAMKFSGSADSWTVNDKIGIKTPGYKELKKLVLKHSGPFCSTDYAVRKMDHIYEYLDFRGAYLNEKLAGAYYYYSSNGYTCIDGLITDQDFPDSYVEETLLKHAVSMAAGTVLFTHAYENSRQRKTLEKLGFREAGRTCEYFSGDIGKK